MHIGNHFLSCFRRENISVVSSTSLPQIRFFSTFALCVLPCHSVSSGSRIFSKTCITSQGQAQWSVIQATPVWNLVTLPTQWLAVRSFLDCDKGTLICGPSWVTGCWGSPLRGLRLRSVDSCWIGSFQGSPLMLRCDALATLCDPPDRERTIRIPGLCPSLS